MGFILPHRFLKTDYGQGLRQVIIRKAGLDTIVDFDGFMVFQSASINTCILILSSRRTSEVNFAQANFTEMSQRELGSLLSGGLSESDSFQVGPIDVSRLSEAPWVFIRRSEESL